MRLLAVDPGIRGCGVATFVNGVLACAVYVENYVKRGDGLDAVAAMVGAVVEGVPLGYWELAAERMQVYTVSRRGSKDPNDLIPLAAIIGGVASHASAATWYKPREWKGTIPKGEAFEARVTDRLSISERSAIQDAGSLTHNVYDAIGIGLYHLGRFTKKRVYPR